jgi:hypothetical protein
VLTNSQISSKHAEIQPLADGRYQVIDVGSTNGTAVNGVKLSAGQPQPLNAGDTITLGGSGGIELHFELTADAPWQASQPQAAGAPGGFGAADPGAAAQPFGGGIGQPPPGPPGFAPAPGGFGPAGQPGPGAPPFPPPQEPFPAAPGGFPPPNQFGPPGGPGSFDGAPPVAGFPPPGGPGLAPFGVPPAQGPDFPPPGGAPFGPPGGPGGFPPPGGPGGAPFGPPFGAPGAPPGAGPGFPPPGGQPFGPPGGYPPPGGAMPVKKRTGRNLFLLAGSIIVLALIVVGIVFGVRTVLNKNPAPPAAQPTAPAATPTTAPTGQRGGAPAALEAQTRPSAEGLGGQGARYSVVICVVGGAASSVAVISRV